jgi:hypothetical protein
MFIPIPCTVQAGRQSRHLIQDGSIVTCEMLPVLGFRDSMLYQFGICTQIGQKP